jgi:hypothetical protein
MMPVEPKISIDQLKKLLSYATCEEAAIAYRKAADEHHGEFACHD